MRAVYVLLGNLKRTRGKLTEGKRIGWRDLACATELSWAEIHAGHEAVRRLTLLWPFHDATHWCRSLVDAIIPPVSVFALPDVEVRSNHLPYRNDQLLLLPGVLPGYVRAFHEQGKLPPTAVTAHVRRISEPTFVVTHFALQTYGHFLLEILPKILLALSLRDKGIAARIAFPSDVGVISQIVESLCPPGALLSYESRHEQLHLERSLHPSLSFQGELHQSFVARLDTLASRLGAADAATRSRRLFLSRGSWTGYRTLSNELELFEVAKSYGFELVVPQTIDWRSQVQMFSNATHILGSFNSALHGGLFAKPGTNVIGFGRVNHFQDAIGSSIGHRIGYLKPVQGTLERYDPNFPRPHEFAVSPDELRVRLDGLFS